MLPPLLSIPPTDTGMNEFLYHNAQDHREIRTAIQTRFNINLPIYQLESIDTKDPSGWLERHASAHNDMNAVLGIAGTDLLDVDFNEPDQVKSWVYLHFQEHQAARTVLGI